MGTSYVADFEKSKKKGIGLKPEVFNLEKETKIINPHKMEKETVNNKVFQTHNQAPEKVEKRKLEKNNAPIISYSSYTKNYPNWKNG